MSDLNSFFAKKDRKKKKRAAPAAAQPAPPPPPSADGAPADNDAAINAATQPPPAPRQDDGWIDFDDPKSLQVNTGGRVVASLKRDTSTAQQSSAATNADANDANGNDEKANANAGGNGASEQTEKFSGWKQGDDVAREAAEKEAAAKEAAAKEAEEAAAARPRVGGVYRPKMWASRTAANAAPGPDVKSAAQFPSLSDAATVNAPKVPASMRAQEKGVKAPVVASSRPRFFNSKNAGK